MLYRFGTAVGWLIDYFNRNLNVVYIIITAVEILLPAVLFRWVFPRLWERPSSLRAASLRRKAGL